MDGERASLAVARHAIVAAAFWAGWSAGKCEIAVDGIMRHRHVVDAKAVETEEGVHASGVRA